ncbi:MAG: hypothetical protein AAFW75_27350, partial [Cyanobacteria bacterium J06636_16]
IAVDRMLIANESLPDWIVTTITRTLFEHDQELREAIIALSASGGESGTIAGASSENFVPLVFEPEAMVSIVEAVSEPDPEGFIPIHDGAVAFYQPFNLWNFVVSKADFFALLITLSLLAYSAYLQLKNLQLNHYITELVNDVKEVMKKEPKPESSGEKDKDLKEIEKRLENLCNAYNKITQEFQDKTQKLSHDAFMQFREVFETNKAMLEKEIEDLQRQASSDYIHQMFDYLDFDKQPEKSLDNVFKDAINELMGAQMFSRESLRTLVITYDLVYMVLKDQKQLWNGSEGKHVNEGFDSSKNSVLIETSNVSSDTLNSTDSR